MNAANERCAIVGTIDPDAYTANTYLTDAIDMSKFDRVLFIVAVGDLTTNNTTDFSVHASATSGGSYGLLAGSAITQLTEAGSDSDKQVLVEVKAIDVLAAGKQFVKGVLVTATAAADAAVIALGFDPQYGPASMYDLASVDEVINV